MHTLCGPWERTSNKKWESRKKVQLGMQGGRGLRSCICCAIMVMCSVSVERERIQLRLDMIFTSIKYPTV